jgi:hypothetical protein
MDPIEWIAFLSPYPAWIKLFLVAGVVLWLIAGIGMLFTSSQSSVAIDSSGSGTVNITSHNQSGGITANSVNTNKQ